MKLAALGALVRRFWKKVDVRGPDECWPWQGALCKGYGILSSPKAGEAPIRAHRLSFVLFNGPLSDELVVRHKCDNTRCVNPRHLEPGTQLENVQDIVRRGRMNPRSLLNLRLGRAARAEAATTENIQCAV